MRGVFPRETVMDGASSAKVVAGQMVKSKKNRDARIPVFMRQLIEYFTRLVKDGFGRISIGRIDKILITFYLLSD